MPVSFPPKDPSEVLNYSFDWTAEIPSDTIASSTVELVVASGVALTSQGFSGKKSTWIVSGGTDGAAVFSITITTASGLKFERYATLPIVSNGAEEFPDGYEVPTVAQFLLLFPEFAGQPGLQAQLAVAARSVSLEWSEGDYALAIALLAAHNLTVASINATKVGGISLAATGPLKTRKVGDVEATFAGVSGSSSSGGGGGSGSFSGTSYGVRYLELLRRNFVGVRVTGYTVGLALPW